MKNYTLREIEPSLWRKVKVKCAVEGISIRQVIINLLTEWVKK